MITFQNISKIYQVGDQEVKALDDVSFSLKRENLLLSWDLQALVKVPC